MERHRTQHSTEGGRQRTDATWPQDSPHTCNSPNSVILAKGSLSRSRERNRDQRSRTLIPTVEPHSTHWVLTKERRWYNAVRGILTDVLKKSTSVAGKVNLDTDLHPSWKLSQNGSRPECKPQHYKIPRRWCESVQMTLGVVMLFEIGHQRRNPRKKRLIS